jgi:hypothetical protein
MFAALPGIRCRDRLQSSFCADNVGSNPAQLRSPPLAAVVGKEVL